MNHRNRRGIQQRTNSDSDEYPTSSCGEENESYASSSDDAFHTYPQTIGFRGHRPQSPEGPPSLGFGYVPDQETDTPPCNDGENYVGLIARQKMIKFLREKFHINNTEQDEKIMGRKRRKSSESSKSKREDRMKRQPLPPALEDFVIEELAKVPNGYYGNSPVPPPLKPPRLSPTPYYPSSPEENRIEPPTFRHNPSQCSCCNHFADYTNRLASHPQVAQYLNWPAPSECAIVQQPEWSSNPLYLSMPNLRKRVPHNTQSSKQVPEPPQSHQIPRSPTLLDEMHAKVHKPSPKPQKPVEQHAKPKVKNNRKVHFDTQRETPKKPDSKRAEIKRLARNSSVKQTDECENEYEVFSESKRKLKPMRSQSPEETPFSSPKAEQAPPTSCFCQPKSKAIDQGCQTELSNKKDNTTSSKSDHNYPEYLDHQERRHDNNNNGSYILESSLKRPNEMSRYVTFDNLAQMKERGDYVQIQAQTRPTRTKSDKSEAVGEPSRKITVPHQNASPPKDGKKVQDTDFGLDRRRLDRIPEERSSSYENLSSTDPRQFKSNCFIQVTTNSKGNPQLRVLRSPEPGTKYERADSQDSLSQLVLANQGQYSPSDPTVSLTRMVESYTNKQFDNRVVTARKRVSHFDADEKRRIAQQRRLQLEQMVSKRLQELQQVSQECLSRTQNMVDSQYGRRHSVAELVNKYKNPGEPMRGRRVRQNSDELFKRRDSLVKSMVSSFEGRIRYHDNKASKREIIV